MSPNDAPSILNLTALPAPCAFFIRSSMTRRAAFIEGAEVEPQQTFVLRPCYEGRGKFDRHKCEQRSLREQSERSQEKRKSRPLSGEILFNSDSNPLLVGSEAGPSTSWRPLCIPTCAVIAVLAAGV